VFAVLFVSDIATSWSSYERLVSIGANWEQAGSDFETFHGSINQECIPMAANGKLELYYLFYSFPNRRSTRLPNETGFIYDSIGTLDSLCYLSYMSKNLCLYMISIYFYICLIYGSVSKGNLLTEISGEGFFFYLIWCFGDSYFPSCPFFLFN
jgi:hypothetical protein